MIFFGEKETIQFSWLMKQIREGSSMERFQMSEEIGESNIFNRVKTFQSRNSPSDV